MIIRNFILIVDCEWNLEIPCPECQMGDDLPHTFRRNITKEAEFGGETCPALSGTCDLESCTGELFTVN